MYRDFGVFISKNIPTSGFVSYSSVQSYQIFTKSIGNQYLVNDLIYLRHITNQFESAWNDPDLLNKSKLLKEDLKNYIKIE